MQMANLHIDVESFVLQQIANGSCLAGLSSKMNQGHTIVCLTQHTPIPLALNEAIDKAQNSPLLHCCQYLVLHVLNCACQKRKRFYKLQFYLH